MVLRPWNCGFSFWEPLWEEQQQHLPLRCPPDFLLSFSSSQKDRQYWGLAGQSVAAVRLEVAEVEAAELVVVLAQDT